MNPSPSDTPPTPLDPTAFPLSGVRLIEASAGTGKTYTIESMVGGGPWIRVPLSSLETGERSQSITATSVGIQTLYCDPAGTGTELFRLTVR